MLNFLIIYIHLIYIDLLPVCVYMLEISNKVCSHSIPSFRDVEYYITEI